MSKQSFEEKAMSAPLVTGVYCRETEVDGVGELSGTTIRAVEATGVDEVLEERVIVKPDVVIVGTMATSMRDALAMAEGRVHMVRNGSVYIGPRSLNEVGRAVGIDFGYGMGEMAEDRGMVEWQVRQYLSSLRSNKPSRGVIGKALRQVCGITDMKAFATHVLRYAEYLEGNKLAREIFGCPDWFRMPEDLQEALKPLCDLDTEEGHRVRWERGMAVGRIGNPYACLVEVYEHGLMSFVPTSEPLTEAINRQTRFCVWEPDPDDVVTMEFLLLKRLSLPADCIERVEIVEGNGATTFAYAPRRAHDDKRRAPQHVTWLECLERVLVEAGRASEIATVPDSLRTVVVDFAKPELEDYTDCTNGAVYDLALHVIDRSTGEVVVHEPFGPIVGSENAIAELEAAMLGAAGYDEQPLAA